jgi:hypothetical protein
VSSDDDDPGLSIGRRMAEEYRTQDEYFLAQVQAIDRLPFKRRADYVSHTVRCANCSDVVVQVLKLNPLRAIKYRSNPVEDEIGESIRLGKDWWYILVDELGEAHHSNPVPFVWAYCRCTNYTFTVANIMERVGKRSTVSPNGGQILAGRDER